MTRWFVRVVSVSVMVLMAGGPAMAAACEALCVDTPAAIAARPADTRHDAAHHAGSHDAAGPGHHAGHGSPAANPHAHHQAGGEHDGHDSRVSADVVASPATLFAPRLGASDTHACCVSGEASRDPFRVNARAAGDRQMPVSPPVLVAESAGDRSMAPVPLASSCLSVRRSGYRGGPLVLRV